MIDAQGTEVAPIVFASSQTPGTRARGDWGGFVINGRAPVNEVAPQGEGRTGEYGSANPADNSGIMRYCRVEFGGRSLTPTNELNGLALQGVGNATVLEFVQIHLGKDDGIEFFRQLADPIGTTRLGGAQPTSTLQNADSGTHFGIEFEARKTLDFLGDALRGFCVAGNLAFIRSEVELQNQGIATETNRPLQGQSPYVVNLALGYDDVESGVSVAFLHNASGERIAEIGTRGSPTSRSSRSTSWTSWWGGASPRTGGSSSRSRISWATRSSSSRGTARPSSSRRAWSSASGSAGPSEALSAAGGGGAGAGRRPRAA